MSDGKKPRSLARRGDNASASPFDGVKIELAIVMLVALGCAIVIMRLSLGGWAGLSAMAGVGFACGGWVALRTRGVVKRHETDDGASPARRRGS